MIYKAGDRRARGYPVGCRELLSTEENSLTQEPRYRHERKLCVPSSATCLDVSPNSFSFFRQISRHDEFSVKFLCGICYGECRDIFAYSLKKSGPRWVVRFLSLEAGLGHFLALW